MNIDWKYLPFLFYVIECQICAKKDLDSITTCITSNGVAHVKLDISFKNCYTNRRKVINNNNYNNNTAKETEKIVNKKCKTNQ
uniref:Uncharacterized protein n=1 Tax=Romanomermis culicivorax TaxID=13658 RepID=A0A915KF07_ROMCU